SWPLVRSCHAAGLPASSPEAPTLQNPHMPTLEPPSVRVRGSFLEAIAELRSEGRGVPGDTSMTGMLVLRFADTWETPEGFAAFVGWLRAQAIETTPRADGMVPATELWWLDGDAFLGRLSIRHRLTPSLLEAGGHLGYDVRPSARRRGHATAMLRDALPIAN